MVAEHNEEQTLPENVPVTMPELPKTMIINTAQHFKAMGDPVRWRILSIIQNQPATAKQLAGQLGVAPGTIGHHLQVLEAAGLAQIVARRLVHGIVAKYYTRTARIFMYDFPPEVHGQDFISLNILNNARDELAESLAAGNEDVIEQCTAHPRMRIAPERARLYRERLNALIDDFLQEELDPTGQVYSICVTMFKAPPYQQTLIHSADEDAEDAP